MFFYVAKILSALFWPSSVIALLVAVGTALVILRRFEAWGRRMLIAGSALLIVCGFGPVGNMLVIPLEQRFERGAVPAEIHGVIILGGFENTAIALARGELSLNEASERLVEGTRVAMTRPNAKVVFTGADGALIGGGETSAAGEVARALMDLGIARERIVLENRSRTTWENAQNLRAILEPRPGQRYVLVTSAFHMPRSVATFRKAGFDVIPWPVDYRTRGPGDLLKTAASIVQGLALVDAAFKEWLGLIAYRVSGRSGELWPAP